MTRLHTCSDCGGMSPTPVCDECQQERLERHKLRHPSAQPVRSTYDEGDDD